MPEFCPLCGSSNTDYSRNYCYDCKQSWTYEITYSTNAEKTTGV